MSSSAEPKEKRKYRSGSNTGSRLVEQKTLVRSTVRQAAKATLRTLRFASGTRSGAVEISSRLTRAECAAVKFWVQRMPKGLADQLSACNLPLKIAVADRLLAMRGSVFINKNPPAIGDVHRQEKHSRRLTHPHAVSYIPERYIVLERALFRQRVEHGRILYHELCHFIWPRLGNARRRRFQEIIQRELREQVRGELGYSSEIRKASLLPTARAYVSHGTFARRLREYVCESFCDTGAYVLLGTERRAKHSEFTLSQAARRRRMLTWKAVALNSQR